MRHPTLWKSSERLYETNRSFICFVYCPLAFTVDGGESEQNTEFDEIMPVYYITAKISLVI